MLTMWMLALGLGDPFLDETTPALPPTPIVGGTEATTCQFPAVVSMREDDETPTMLSGSPRLVRKEGSSLLSRVFQASVARRV